MSICGHGIEDLGESLSWSKAKHILKTLSIDSALARDLDPDLGSWNSILKTNYLLADVVDLLQAIHYALVCIGGGKATKPRPIDRPGKASSDDGTTKHYGKGAMPAKDLYNWIFSRK